MTFSSRIPPRAVPTFAVSILALALAGCGGGSGSGGGGNDTVSLSEEEQVLGAAATGMEQAGVAQGFAEAQANTRDDPTEDSTSTSSVTTASYTDPEGDTVPLTFECPNSNAGSDYGGEGEYRVAEGGDRIAIHDIDFPDAFSNSLSDGQGTPDDILLRSDCRVTLDGDEFFRISGSADIAQEENIDGSAGNRAVYARIGGHTGNQIGDTPDVSEAMTTGTQFGDTFTESGYRAEIYSCEGCVNGDLADFSGNPDLDTMSVSFMNMDINLSELNASFRVGESLNDPLTMKTSWTGTAGQAEVELDGRLSYSDQETDCGYDVTYATDQALLIDDYAQDGSSETVGGKMDITVNESGNSYTVEYQSNGDIRVTDSSGNEVTPEPSSDAESCGFVGGETDSGGSTDASALEGEWASPCNQVSPDRWAIATYDFSSSVVDLSLTTYTDDSCSSEDQTESFQYSYSVGDTVPQTDGRGDAAEIDYTSDSENDIFDIYRIENGVLYFGAPDPGTAPDSEAGRPDDIDIGTEWLYTNP